MITLVKVSSFVRFRASFLIIFPISPTQNQSQSTTTQITLKMHQFQLIKNVHNHNKYTFHLLIKSRLPLHLTTTITTSLINKSSPSPFLSHLPSPISIPSLSLHHLILSCSIGDVLGGVIPVIKYILQPYKLPNPSIKTLRKMQKQRARRPSWCELMV